MLVDLQVLVSNGESERIIREFKQTTLDALCLVGFKKLPDAQAVEEIRAAGIRAFVGVEIPLSKGHLLAYPHDLPFPVENVVDKNLDDDEIISQCRAAGCAVVACHPYHKDSIAAMGDRVFQHRGLDAVMVVTSQSPVHSNDLAIESLEAVGAPAAGGSASALPDGKAATLFVTEVLTQEQLVEELRTGDFWAVALGNEDRWSVHEDDGGRPGGFRRDGPRREGDRGGDRGGFRGGRPDNRGRPGDRNDRFNDRNRDRGGDRYSGGADRRGPGGGHSGPRGPR